MYFIDIVLIYYHSVFNDILMVERVDGLITLGVLSEKKVENPGVRAPSLGPVGPTWSGSNPRAATWRQQGHTVLHSKAKSLEEQPQCGHGKKLPRHCLSRDTWPHSMLINKILIVHITFLDMKVLGSRIASIIAAKAFEPGCAHWLSSKAFACSFGDHNFNLMREKVFMKLILAQYISD